MQNNNNIANIATGTIMDGLKSGITENADKELETLEEAIQNKRDMVKMIQNMKPKTMKREHKKIGRNELCPCGSGKKYKNCCLKTGEYEKLVVA